MAALPLAGIATIAVGGKTYQLAADLTWGVATVNRETLIGMDGIQDFKETPVPCFIAGTFRDNPNIKIADFNNMTDVNIVVALKSGKTLIGSKMWCVNAQEVKATDGTFEVRFEGPSVTEQ